MTTLHDRSSPNIEEWEPRKVQAVARDCVLAAHRRLGRPLDDAALEDAIAETVVIVWSRQSSCREPERLEAWVYGIARRRVLKCIERRGVHDSRWTAIDRLDESVVPTEMPVESDTRFARGVLRAVQSCGTTIARIAVAHAVDGLSFREIGEQLHLKETTAKNRFYRHLPEIRRRLSRYWHDLTGVAP